MFFLFVNTDSLIEIYEVSTITTGGKLDGKINNNNSKTIKHRMEMLKREACSK